MPPAATVVITTRNRLHELCVAIESALAQRPAVEVLVIDDGSTDGTPDVVSQRYPAVRLERMTESQGYIVQRNRAAAIANTAFIISIDDDAAFSTQDVVAHTIAEFDDPRIGAVAIPFANVNQGPRILQVAPDGEGHWIASTFIGTAHAIRQAVFTELGGYRAFYFHQGEERDLCIRMLEGGHVVRLGGSDPIHHFESPRRDTRRMDLYGRRNDILFAWYNVPLIALPWRLAMWTMQGLVFGFRVRRPWRMTRGLAMGYAGILKQWRSRRPVQMRTYRLYRRLQRRGATPLTQIADALKKGKSR